MCPVYSPPPPDFCKAGEHVETTTNPQTGCMNGFICVKN